MPLGEGSDQAFIAEVNRRLVTAGVDVYRLDPSRKSLEEWFLQVTARIGDPS